ncbi:MAG TPA: glutathionylspermidine synthase family protein [Usitatibacteraceae bacterium]|nr:glutathionylspermidine synthase family protein [Usitatibacteraceae bacterium]
MKRLNRIPRPDWPRKMEELGFSFHSIDGVYWDERVCYEFSAAQIDTLESATNTLHQLCIEAAGHVVDSGDYERFAIPREFIPMVERSWNDDEATLYGRFDLSWDGRAGDAGAPKMLEYNADTPTALIEASVAQWYWMQEAVQPNEPHADQFNSLHEKLIARWGEIGAELDGKTVHFTCVGDSEEDSGNLDYLCDVATQAGLTPKYIDIGDIGWDAVAKTFADLENNEIKTLFKLYPWEWLVREPFGLNLIDARMRLIEPAWKMLLSNKAILPVLWKLFPDHPNLLPAYYEPQKFAADFVKKPILSREGANVTIKTATGEIAVPGEYGAEGYIYQGYHPLPVYGSSHTVIGSWIVGDEAAGIGIREDESPVTKNSSRFVPHYFR